MTGVTRLTLAAAGVIFMDIRLACLTSFKYFIVLYMLVEWLMFFHYLYSVLAWPVFRFIFRSRITCAAAAVAAQGNHETQRSRHVSDLVPGKKKSLGASPKIVMERLGMFWDPNDQTQTIGSDEISNIFDEDEPSVEEVKEAFDVFDKNRDGYIDTKELQNVLSAMGFLQVSESDCVNMIAQHDMDKDEKINFTEFLKLMGDSLN